MQNSESEKTLDNLTTEANLPAKSSDASFEPTTIVLAKVKGYPPWPAMILDESLLPEYIAVKKPKKVKQPAKRKNAKPIEILPVRFFSDDTYIWIKNTDLKILNDETIQMYIDKHQTSKRKDNLLFEAYKLASNPPDMELFVEYGSKGKKAVKKKLEEDDDLEIDMVDDLEEEGLEDEEEPEESVDEDFEASSRKRRKTNSTTLKKKTSGPKTKARAKGKVKTNGKIKEEISDPAEEGYDSDWGLSGLTYDYEDGNYIFEDEDKQSDFTSEFPSVAEIQEKYNRYQKQFNEINSKLSTCLLIEEDVKEGEVLNYLKKLKSIKGLPKSIFLKSRLFKLLILLIRKPVESFPYKRIRTEVEGILRSWFDLSVDTLTLEELNRVNEELNNMNKSQTESQEPENREGSVIEETKKEESVSLTQGTGTLHNEHHSQVNNSEADGEDSKPTIDNAKPLNEEPSMVNGN